MPRKITTGRVGKQVLGNLSTSDNTVSSVETNTNIILEPNGTGIVDSKADVQLSGQSGIRFADGDSSNYVLLKGPSALTSNRTLVLPSDVPSAGEVVKSDASGNLFFEAASLPVVDRTAADNNTYYITMSTATSGTQSSISTAGTRLQFVPNPGRLSTNELRVTSTTASSSTSSGALVVSGGLGVGGQLTAVDIVETSSIALKENIEPITNGLESILALKGVTYNRKADENKEQESGLIAEWTEEVIPELVTRDANGEVVGIKYTKLTAYLIEAVKTLKAEIDQLKRV